MTSENAYYNEKREPIIKKSFCAFADILGFKELIIQSDREGTANQVLQNLHAIVSGEISRMQAIKDFALGGLKSFTDNIILGFPLPDNDDGESQFGLLIQSLTKLQYKMAIQGFFMRGGVAVGPLYMDDNIVFGKALLDAYDIEQTVAVYPRIVFSPASITIISKHLSYYAEGEAPHNNDLVRSEQSIFANYLVACKNEDDNKFDVQGLINHRDHIINKIGSTRTGVLEKFKWLAAYHNWFVRNSIGNGDTKHLLIDLSVADFNFDEFK